MLRIFILQDLSKLKIHWSNLFLYNISKKRDVGTGEFTVPNVYLL